MRILDAPPARVWAVVSDPHLLPRWWPMVERVESVAADGFTEVLRSASGRALRADFRVQESAAPTRRRWAQQLEGTPFERLFSRAETAVMLEPAGDGSQTRVTIVLDQVPRGVYNGLGGLMLRRAARKVLAQAVESLAGIV